jgi:hypothetical protein
MTLTGIADKIAAQTLLTGSREQATAVLHLVRGDAANRDLFGHADAASNEGLVRGRMGIALLQRHLAQVRDDANALKLLLKAAEHIGDQATLEWGSGLMLQLDPHNAFAHCQLAKAAHSRGDEDGRERHFSHLIEILRTAVAERKVDLALDLEARIYNGVVKLVEEENFVHAKMARIIPLMDELGRHVRDLLPELPAPQGRFNPPRIGFVFPTGALLAHSKVLLSICQAMSEAGANLVKPAIYVVGQAMNDFLDAFRACGAPVKVISGEQGGPSNSVIVNRLLGLRQALAADGIRLATWVSVPAGGAFYMAARFAPQQAYWSMKFHGLIAPGIDHYVSCMSSWETEKIVHGQKWLCGPISFKDALAGGEPTKIPEIRARYGKDAILLGVLAREEKIFSLPYLGAVAEILETSPKAVFLWSGRSEHAGIRKFFTDRGLNDRTPYVGWVNTATFAPALDIFLETFPFGCGMTAAQALAAGVPVVDFKDWSSVLGFHLEPLLSGRAGSDEDRAKVRGLFTGRQGEDCFNMATDTAAYVAIARRLIDDTDYRREVGAAGQRFYDAYLGNPVFSAERFARIFRDLALTEQPQRKAS